MPSGKGLLAAFLATFVGALVGTGAWAVVANLRPQETKFTAGPGASSSPTSTGRPTAPVACTTSTVLQASPPDPNDPSPRNSAALAYDAVRRQVVLFGGDAGMGGLLGDTWVWNGSSWRQKNPIFSPAPRAYAQMTFDAARGLVVLFGGGGGGGLDDTWTWDGSNWTEQHPAVRPPVAAGSAMDYDAALGQVVLVARGTGPGPQTWAWDGATWHQIPTAQSPRNHSTAMAYEPVAKKLILFDHFDQATWTFDAAAGWSKARAVGPSQASLPNMAYDAATRSMVLFADGGQGATWTWDGAAWTQRCPAATPPRLSSTGPHAAMAYDADAGVMVVFGGAGAASLASNATWIWDGTTWAQWHAKS